MNVKCHLLLYRISRGFHASEEKKYSKALVNAHDGTKILKNHAKPKINNSQEIPLPDNFHGHVCFINTYTYTIPFKFGRRKEAEILTLLL